MEGADQEWVHLALIASQELEEQAIMEMDWSGRHGDRVQVRQIGTSNNWSVEVPVRVGQQHKPDGLCVDVYKKPAYTEMCLDKMPMEDKITFGLVPYPQKKGT